MLSANPNRRQPPFDWSSTVTFVVGIFFLFIILIITLFITKLSEFQILVFRVVLAVSATAILVTIPGTIDLKLPFLGIGVIQAGGALVLFILVFLVNPPPVASNRYAIPLVDSVGDTASRMCLTATTRSDDGQQLSLNRNGNDELSRIIKKVLNFGISNAAKYQKGILNETLQNQISAAISEGEMCELQVFVTLVSTLLKNEN